MQGFGHGSCCFPARSPPSLSLCCLCAVSRPHAPAGASSCSGSRIGSERAPSALCQLCLCCPQTPWDGPAVPDCFPQVPLGSPVLVPGRGRRHWVVTTRDPRPWLGMAVCSGPRAVCGSESGPARRPHSRRWRGWVCGCLLMPSCCGRWKCVWTVVRLPARPSRRAPGRPPLKPASKLLRLHVFSAGSREWRLCAQEHSTSSCCGGVAALLGWEGA